MIQRGGQGDRMLLHEGLPCAHILMGHAGKRLHLIVGTGFKRTPCLLHEVCFFIVSRRDREEQEEEGELQALL